MNGNWKSIEQQLGQITGETVQIEPLSGGCINQAFKLTSTDNHLYFVKTNSPSKLDMFAAEAAGLDEIAKNHSIRVPNSICYGSTKVISYHILEYIPLNSHINQQQTGEQLAQMHLNTSTEFGWHRDNTIGSTRQSNKKHDNWSTFWANERLFFQLNLAKNSGYPEKAFKTGLELVEKLDVFFTGYQPIPSLLHGDLWSGNCGSDSTNNPVIYDPAVYYGDRETDIAMTELFGGFSADFYDSYNAHFKLDSGYTIRKKLYNLYHILNHYNLFGGGYGSQAATMTKQLLAEI
jgi:fructosamine-3-kinase